MAKQLNQAQVNLVFTADTNKAKAQINDLITSLQKVAQYPGKASNLFDDRQIKQASQAALELQQHLNNAVNVNTGKLDLSRFSSSLKAANKDLNQYYNQLLNAGKVGEQAFFKLAQSIATADAPLTRMNKKLEEFGTTLKNTARWQISSSILHGFMGAVQSAYGYAQDLNESLNNIRIVTNQNTDQMAKFAEEANRAAKALSTTTTDYTNASLIYYQQGLTDQEVKERTDITIKMANIARQSAEIISDQMTAVWNNFDDGSKSLEYYADVMTALGAATASSTDEISEGLNKFASIAETVGLSYEYAAAALATVTAETRESADIVGNAFKTIFGRLQGLKLGETLDDGVTLNKYSQALDTVGVNVLEVNGDLKEMDDILVELGAKWDTLTEAQQTALAQTVGGAQQYARFIAIMDNWGKIQENLNIAYTSEGALQEQMDIYSESWEAARDRVRAAAEDIYRDLINDEGFIDLLNSIEKVLEGINGLVEGFGGLKGIAIGLGSVLLNVFAKNVPTALENLKQNLMVITGQAKQAMMEVQSDTIKRMDNIKSDPNSSLALQAKASGIEAVANMQQKLIIASKHMSSQEQNEYRTRIQNVSAIYEEVEALGRLAAEAEDAANAQKKAFAKQMGSNVKDLYAKHIQAQDKVAKLSQELDSQLAKDGQPSSEEAVRITAIEEALKKARIEAAELDAEISSVVERFSTAGETRFSELLSSDRYEDLKKAFNNLEGLTLANNGEAGSEDIALITQAAEKAADAVENCRKQISVLDSEMDAAASQAKLWEKNAKEIDKNAEEVKQLKQNILNYIEVLRKAGEENGVVFEDGLFENLKNDLETGKQSAEQYVQTFSKFIAQMQDAEGGVSTFAGRLNQLDAEFSELEILIKSTFRESIPPELNQSLERVIQTLIKYRAEQQQAESAASKMPTATFKASTAITEFGSSLMATQSAIITLKSAIEVFSDESSTAFEKVGAAVSILTTAIMTVNSFQGLATSLTLLDAKAKTAQAAATGVAAAATMSLGAALVIVAAAMGAAILIIWGLVAAFQAIKANSPEGRLKAIQEESDALSESLNTLSSEIDNVSSAFESYDSVVSELERCEKGTDAWYQKLLAIHAKTREIEAEYSGEIAAYEVENGSAYVWNEEAGTQVLSDDFFDWTTNKKQDNFTATEIAGFFTQGEVKQQSAAITQQDFDNKFESYMTDYNARTGEVSSFSGAYAGGGALEGIESVLATFSNDFSQFLASGMITDEKGNYISKTNEEFAQYVSEQTGGTVATDVLTGFLSYLQGTDIVTSASEAQKAQAVADIYTEDQVISQVASALFSAAATEMGIEGDATNAALGLINGTVEGDESATNATSAFLEDVDSYFSEDSEQRQKYENYSDDALFDIFNNLGQYTLDKVQGDNFTFSDAEGNETTLSKENIINQLISRTLLNALGNPDSDISLAVQSYVDSVQQQVENGVITGLEETPDSNYVQALSDKEITEGLEYGDAIEVDEYNQLSSTAQNYFQLMKDGMYHLVGDAEALQKELSAEEKGNLAIMATEDNVAASVAAESWGISEDRAISRMDSWAETATTGAYTNFDSDYLLKMVEALDLVEEYNAKLAAPPKEQQAFLQEVANKWLEIRANAQMAGDTMAMNAQSLGELEFLQSAGEVSDGIYQGTLMNLGGQYENTEQEIQAYQNALEGKNEAEIAAAEASLEAAIRAGELSEETGIAAEEIERYADELSHFEEYADVTEKALTEMAKDQLRFDKAVENAAEHMEEWEEALDVAAETGHLSSEAAEEMAETYGDLLDIDGDQLSETFLNNTENLENMKKALEGDEEAYQRLQQAAGEEILAKVGIDKSQYQADLDAIGAMAANAEGMGLADLEAGASLDNQNFLNGLSQMVTAAGMTADQATSYLSSMGIDAEVVEEPKTVTETIAHNLVPIITPIEAQMGESTTSFSSVRYKTTPVRVKKTIAGTGLRVTSANKSSGGNIKFNGSNAAQGGGSSGGSGGGGGGSSKKDKKNYKDEIERYHEINEVIEDLTIDMEALAEAKDRAFGADKLAIMDQEIEKQKELMSIQEQYLAEIEDYYKQDKAAIAAYGAEFDEEGRITNYDEIMKQQIDKFNASRTEEAEEAYKEFIEILEQYEETNNLYQEQEQELINQRYELIDMQLEAVQEEVSMREKMADDYLSVIEFMLSRIEDSAFSAAETIGLLGKQVQQIENKIATNMDGIQKTLEKSGLSSDQISRILSGEMSSEEMADLGLTDDALESIREYRDNIFSLNEELIELRTTVMDEVLESFEEWSDAMDEQIDKLDHYNEIMDNYKNIIELVGEDMLGISDDLSNALDDAVITNSVNKLSAAKDKMDALRQSEANAQKELEEARARGNQQDIELWERTLADIQAQTNDAEEEMMAAWQEGLEAAGELFEKQVEEAISAYEEALSGTFGSLDALQEAFDQQSEISERYLADYQKIYELSKLNRDITNSIDETDNIKAKKELRKLQEEINELQESDTQMSQYDLDFLQKKYELKLAEIALEEAQNAKSQVRMSRDSEGNWSYIYTADQDQIDQAQQNYEDKLYEMQELNNEYIKEVQQNILQSEIELANALRELDRAKFKSDEEYYAEVARITEYYTGQHNYWLNEANKATENNKEIYDEDWRNYSNATGYKISSDKDYVDKFDETILAQLAGYETIEEAQNNFSHATSVMVKDLNVAFSNWSETVNRLMQAADTSITEFSSDLAASIYGDGTEENPGLVNASNDAADSVEDMSKRMTEDFKKVAEAATSWQETYSNWMDTIIQQNLEFADSLNDLLAAKTGYDKDGNSLPEDDGNTNPDPEEDNKDGEETGGGQEETIDDRRAKSPTGWLPSDYTGYTYSQYSNRKSNGTKAIQWALQQMGYDIGSHGVDGVFGPDTEKAVKQFQSDNGIGVDGIVGSQTRYAFQANKYKTGGLVTHTGWGWLDGTLEQPELVLNANDTQNLISALDIVHSIAQMIDLNAQAQQLGIGMLTAATAQNTAQVLEQEVTIHAEFPNATDHNEIELAFRDLTNIATQFANRKNK